MKSIVAAGLMLGLLTSCHGRDERMAYEHAAAQYNACISAVGAHHCAAKKALMEDDELVLENYVAAHQDDKRSTNAR